MCPLSSGVVAEFTSAWGVDGDKSADPTHWLAITADMLSSVFSYDVIASEAWQSHISPGYCFVQINWDSQ